MDLEVIWELPWSGRPQLCGLTACPPVCPRTLCQLGSFADESQCAAPVQVNLEVLREVAWSGCPPPLRADCWRLLLGYLSPSHDRR